jgi:hypothetical protein
MSDKPIFQFEDDVVDIKQQSLYARLKRLFSTDVIVRNVGGKQIKIKDTDNIMYATDRNSLRDRFNRIRSTASNAYSRDFALSYQAARMDLFRDYDTMDCDPIIACLAPTTCVSTLEGFVAIKELAEKYTNGETFKVWSWDNDKHKLTIGTAHHPRKTGTKKIIEIHLDNNEILKCTEDHRIMLVDGTYKEAGKLLAGESLMPFYHKINKHHGYQEIKSLGKRYKYTHRYIFEDVFEQNVGPDNIHHKNNNKLDNRPENLQRLSPEEHLRHHHIDTSTRLKTGKTIKKLWESDEYRLRAMSGLKAWQNSDDGKRMMSQHRTYINKKKWKEDSEYALKMTSIFSDHATKMWENPDWKAWKRQKHSDTMKLKYANDPAYKEKTKRRGKENGRYNASITTESILCEGIKHTSLIEFAKAFNFGDVIFKNEHNKCQFLSRRLKESGYQSWTDYKNKFKYSNHKVVKIMDNNEVTDVYDLTVDIYENFAIKQGVIVSNSALDIYADECLTLNELKQMLVVHSKNSNIKKILHNLFYDILNIEGNMWSWTRNMVKYGDFFLRLYITPEYGVYMVEPISAYNVERIENADPYNKRYVKFQIRPTDTAQAEVVENYEMAHFRLLSDSNFLPYGKAMIEGARRVWKQLSLMEDAMLIHRVMRAPERRIYKVDVGAIPPNEVDAYMEKLISKVKKVPYMDERTGDYNLRFNLQSMLEDIYLPVRGGDSGTEIDTLAGMEWTGIDDLDYIKHKMMAALKIPKAFLGYEEGISGKATLASEDVRFARTIQRIQRILVSELSKIAIVHLYAQGYRDESLVDFELELTNPSTIFEREKVEIWGDKVSVAADMMENKLFSKDWIYKNIFNMSDEDKTIVNDQILNDTKQRFRLTSIEEEGNDPAKPAQKINPGDIDGGGGGGPEGGPDLGGMDDGPEGGPGGPEGGPPEGGPGGIQEKVEQDQSDRDQTGRKDATQYPFGEDPRGHLGMKSKPGSDRETRYRPRTSPLGMNEGVGIRPKVDAGIINNLQSFLKKPLLQEEKELRPAGKSLLDESNILGE